MHPRLPPVPMQVFCMEPTPPFIGTGGTPESATGDNNKDEDDNIEEVDITQSDPTEIINVDAGSDGEQNQKYQDENPVNTSSQNQDNVPDTNAMPVITSVDDKADDCTYGDNPNGTVEVEDVEKDDDCNDDSDK